MKTTIKVKKWGNSLGIRIPSAVAKDLGLSDNSSVQIVSNNSSATIKPLTYKGMTVDELFKNVTPDNVHPLTDWGPDVGAERWYDEE